MTRTRRRRAPLWAAALLLVSSAAARAAPPRTAAERDFLATTEARRAFRGDDRLAPLNLGVSVRGGVVAVFGPVPTPELARRALELAGSLPGVTSVSDDLTRLPQPDKFVESVRSAKGRTFEEPKLRPAEAVVAAPAAPGGTVVGRFQEGRTAGPAGAAVEYAGPSLSIADADAQPAPAVAGREERFSDFAGDVERLRRSDGRFAGLRAEVSDGVVRLSGSVAALADAQEFVQKAAFLSGFRGADLPEGAVVSEQR